MLYYYDLSPFIGWVVPIYFVMKQENLFGELQEVDQGRKKLGKYQVIKARNKYGTAKNSVESCKNCVNVFGIRANLKTFYKCKLIGSSSSEATDIKLKDTCNKFKLKK